MVIGKRGWIRIMEASIAIMILGGVLLVVFNNQAPNTDSSDYIRSIMHEVVDQVYSDETLVNYVLSENETMLNSYVGANIPNVFLNYSLLICDLTNPIASCELNSELQDYLVDRDLYVEDIIVSSNLTEYNPKLVRFYVWVENEARQIEAIISSFFSLSSSQLYTDGSGSSSLIFDESIVPESVFVNDTRFAIDSGYNLVNASVLEHGNYSLLISVYDTSGNLNSEVVDLEVLLVCDYSEINYQGEICLSGAFGYWNFDDDFSDVTGINPDPTEIGTPTILDGAVDLDGVYGSTGDALSISTANISEIENEFTVSAWVLPLQNATTQGRMPVCTYQYQGGTGTNDSGWYFGQVWTGDYFSLAVYDGNGTYTSPRYNGFFAQYLNSWTHVVGTFEASGFAKLYINGVMVAEDATAIPSYVYYSGNKLDIGRRSYNLQSQWNGSIDEVFVLTRALNDTEIQEIYNLGR